ncbi:hypothetical protein MASR2M70_12510 [Bacillota bacterium]
MNARKPYIYEALLSFGFLIVVMAVSIAVRGTLCLPRWQTKRPPDIL